MWFPAIVLCILMISFNLLADGLRDAFDPKMKRIGEMYEWNNFKCKKFTSILSNIWWKSSSSSRDRFRLEKGETLAIVGESGSGKSVTTRSIMQLLSANALVENGEIIFEQENILEKSESEMQQITWEENCDDFQDPMTS